MGLSFSYFLSTSPPAPEPGLGDMPESLVASVLVHLDPPQICKLAMLNRAFSRASSADFVWDSKLPVNYKDVIGKVFQDDDVLSKGLCKRDLYAKLCAPNFFDGGKRRKRRKKERRFQHSEEKGDRSYQLGADGCCCFLEGDFEMKHIDKIGAQTFSVAIAPFSLSTFGDGADGH